MEELFDIYDENKNKLGRTKVRYKDTIEEGEYAIGVQAIIINSKKQILISQRSAKKSIYPLKWECNGGAVLAGETFIQGLVREIYEELGIMLKEEDAIYFNSIKRSRSFKEIYLFKKDIDISELRFADGEAIAGKWVYIDEFIDMFNSGEIVENVNFDREDYYKSLELLNLK
jgi:isopentenyldiphosphate isomerase